jgi:ABC-type amino acid transport substrate-binding protein
MENHDALEDGTLILNPTIGTPEAAKDLLLGYFDAAVADRIIAHYITAPATDAGIVVNADAFFTSTVVGVAPEELTVAGSKADGFTRNNEGQREAHACVERRERTLRRSKHRIER